MNEEELKKEIEKKLTRTLIKAVDESKEVWFNMGFQKGKLEQKKEELDFIENQLSNYIPDILNKLRRRKEQLQKEISVPEKQVQIEEEKEK